MRRKKIHQFINFNNKFNKFIYILIILNVIAIILESYQGLKTGFASFFYYFEIFSVLIFSVEYILRIWTAPLDDKFKNLKIGSQFGFMVSTLGIIDLLAILPFYLPLIFIQKRSKAKQGQASSSSASSAISMATSAASSTATTDVPGEIGA